MKMQDHKATTKETDLQHPNLDPTNGIMIITRIDALLRLDVSRHKNTFKKNTVVDHHPSVTSEEIDRFPVPVHLLEEDQVLEMVDHFLALIHQGLVLVPHREIHEIRGVVRTAGAGVQYYVEEDQEGEEKMTQPEGIEVPVPNEIDDTLDHVHLLHDVMQS